MTSTDEMQDNRRIYESYTEDSKSELLGSIKEVETLRHQQSILPGAIHLTGACVQHNAELRKTNVAQCRSKYNTVWLHNPTSGRYDKVRIG